MRKFLLLFVAFSLFSAGQAAPPRPAKSADSPKHLPSLDPRHWTVEDVVESESATGFHCSPDGRWVVWVKRTADRERNERVAHLMRSNLADGHEIQLTRGSESCLDPHWSPDGKRLAFLSTRSAPEVKASDKPNADDEPHAQLWLMDPFGGEPWPLTDFPRGVQTYGWAGSDALVFVAQEEASRREKKLKDDRDDTVLVEDEKHEPPTRLYRVTVESKKVTRLTDNTDRINSLAVSPDGRQAVTIHGRSLRFIYDNRVKPIVILHDLESGKHKQVFRDPKLNVGAVRWALDSRGFYVTNEHSSRPELAQAGVTELWFRDLASGREARIDLQWDKGLSWQEENARAPGYVVTRDGFLALLADGVRNRAARYTRADDGWRRDWLTGDQAANLFGFAVSADARTILYAHSAAATPTQWYRARLDGVRLDRPVQLAEVNKQVRQRARARTEVVRWKGGFNEEVEGILYYPHGYQPGTRYPLVVMIHGGPASADFDSWEESWAYPANLMCQRGAFVLKPNYHGSTNYGLKWVESIANGKYAEPELEDIEKGVDSLIARSLVDPARLGLLGWSNGAILTNVLITQTTRYRAASAGAGNVEYVSDWASCEFGDAFDRFYLGKSPLQDPQLYWRKSPFYRLDKVRTPTLIFFGKEDRVVPTQQGWMEYRALQQLGKAPVRFVLFPDEKHSLRKLSHQRRKLEEELAWFDRHLFGTAQTRDESLQPDSPLAWALKCKKSQRDGRRYGLREKGRLIPEIVSFHGLHVGRFEVTRAQFAEFDRTYGTELARANYPASGISFEQARAYCSWLSKTTGRRYRLPGAAEAEKLYAPPAPGENTLDHWAGYAPNPDDTTHLRQKARQLGGAAPLLAEVGRYRGEGDKDLVFDLGGNVAEWVTTSDGKPELRGGSADTPAAARQPVSQAAPEYRGFRVIQEKMK